MKIIKFTYPNGSILHTTLLTTRWEVRCLFWSYGINAHVFKILDKYVISFGHTSKLDDTDVTVKILPVYMKAIDACTAKYWLELAEANCPESCRCTPLDDGLRKFFKYPDVKSAVQKETLL